MANFYYYFLEVKRGPVGGPELKILASKGIITPETIIENEDGKQHKASNVKGLVCDSPPLPEEILTDTVVREVKLAPIEVLAIGLHCSEVGNAREAAHWFREAAEDGLAEAQFNLGICYNDGIGVERDWGEALAWFCKAGEQGNADAQYNAAVYYHFGHVEKDLLKAEEWYSRAAELGHAEAKMRLQYGIHD